MNVPTADVSTRRRPSTAVVALEARSKTRRRDYRKLDSCQTCSAAVPSILPEMGRCLWRRLCEKSHRHPRAELLSGQPEVQANCRGHLSGPRSSCSFYGHISSNGSSVLELSTRYGFSTNQFSYNLMGIPSAANLLERSGGRVPYA